MSIKQETKKHMVAYRVKGATMNGFLVDLILARLDSAELSKQPKNEMEEMVGGLVVGFQQLAQVKREPETTLIQLTEEEYTSFNRPTIGDLVEVSINITNPHDISLHERRG
jgi:hypothetical protein